MKKFAKTLEEAEEIQKMKWQSEIFKLSKNTHPKKTRLRSFFIGSEFEWLNL